MATSTRENNLRIYEAVTRDNGPAMTWGMHGVNFLDIGDHAEAERFLNKSYQEYMREPFKVWCEVGPQYVGAINFITGAGGFLQVILNGYGGIRPKLGWLQVNQPQPQPHGDGTLYIKGLRFMGSKYDVQVDGTTSAIKFTMINPQKPLKVVYADGNEAAVTLNEMSKLPFCSLIRNGIRKNLR